MQVHSFKRNQKASFIHSASRIVKLQSLVIRQAQGPTLLTSKFQTDFYTSPSQTSTQSNDPRSHRISTPPAAVGRHAPACCRFCGHPDLPARSHRLFARRITFVASVAIALRMHTALNSLKKQRLRQFRAGNCNGNAGRPEGGCVNTPTSISRLPAHCRRFDCCVWSTSKNSALHFQPKSPFSVPSPHSMVRP